MTIWPFTIERFAEISTIALHIYFLYRTFDTKVGVRTQVLAGVVFASVRIAYYVAGFGYRPFFSVVAGIIYASVVFAGQFRAYVVWTIFPVSLDGVVDASILFFYLLFPNTIAAQVQEPGVTRIVIIIVERAILFVAYYLSTKKIEKSNSLTWQDCFSLLVVSIGCWILVEVVFRYRAIPINKTADILLAVGSISLLLMMASVMTLYNRLTVNGKELAQSKLQVETIKMTEEHVDQIKDMHSELTTVRHDLHNHFAAIAGYLKSKEYSALEQYIENLTDYGIDTYEYTSHPVINTLISSKASIARRTGVDFTAILETPDELPISDVDVCILISNILDNAFEANDKAIAPRFINLNTRVVNSYWVVACRNATEHKGKFRAAGSLRSTKEIKGIHGIGTKQIQRIAEKSGGFVTYRHENYEFTTLAMIKLHTQP